MPPAEQPIINPEEVAQAASLENHAAKPTAIEVQTDDVAQVPDIDEGRWDHDKAETLATVLKEDQQFDEKLDDHIQLKGAVESGEYEDQDPTVRYEQKRIDESKEKINELEEVIANPDTDSLRKKQAERSLENRRESLAYSEEDLSIAKPAARAEGQEKVKEKRDAITELSDKKLTPFEELYDLNPEAFATMPTSEFMDVARKFSDANAKLELWEAALTHTLADDIAKAIEEKQTMTFREARDSFAGVYRNLVTNADSVRIDDDPTEAIGAIFEDSFDKTPREVMTEVKTLADKYTARLKEHRDAARAKRDEIINTYKPDSDQKES